MSCSTCLDFSSSIWSLRLNGNGLWGCRTGLTVGSTSSFTVYLTSQPTWPLKVSGICPLVGSDLDHFRKMRFSPSKHQWRLNLVQSYSQTGIHGVLWLPKNWPDFQHHRTRPLCWIAPRIKWFCLMCSWNTRRDISLTKASLSALQKSFHQLCWPVNLCQLTE